MQPDDINLDDTMFGRVLSVVGNDNIKWQRYIQSPFAAIRAAYPLYRDWRDMNDVGKDVSKYNRGKTKEQKLDSTQNDTYFHQHAMYDAAQQGVWSALAAALAGELKEKYWDKPKKLAEGKLTEAQIDEDSKKDLKNNYFAIKMALKDNKPVDEVIIPNPTVQAIREKRKNGKI